MKLEQSFTFDPKLRMTLLGMMAIGVICMVITFFGDSEYHPRFWSNFLINSVFFTGIAFLALMLLAAKSLAYSGWHTVFKRIWEAYSMFLIVGLGLMLIVVVGLLLGWHHLYHWADADSVAHDPILEGKSGFLNKTIFTLFTIVILGVWYFFAMKLRNISLSEDTHGTHQYNHYKKYKFWGAILLPIGGFTSAALIWQWVMSVDAHWYSTLFAWYGTISWLVAMLSLTLLTIIYLKSKGYLEVITADHIHDLGKYLFGFSIFWTYLWFSQYMLIWYGNVGEETIYFRERADNYRFLFLGNLVINFVLPFFILMRNDTKRKMGTIAFVSIFTFLGHWVDYHLMIKPGVLHTAHELAGHHEDHSDAHGEETIQMSHVDDMSGDHGVVHADTDSHGHSNFTPGFTLPGFLEFGTMIGFLGLFLFVFFINLSKANLLPVNDPYLHESFHHHV